MAPPRRWRRTIVRVTNPIGGGFVSSLVASGNNRTGLSDAEPPIGGKWREMAGNGGKWREMAARGCFTALAMTTDKAGEIRVSRPSRR
jgi:hypothetical protein